MILGQPIPDAYYNREIQLEQDDEQEIWEKCHPNIGRRKKNILKVDFLKKYIYYAKNRFQPQLTQEASDYISEVYGELRNKTMESGNTKKTLPITPRTLETLIRLSTAHAKARLSTRVEEVR